MSLFWPPLSSQAAWKVAVPATGVDGGVGELLRADEQQLVVAHQGLAVAARRGGFRGEPHDEVDDPDAIGAAVGEVAQEPEPGVARCPVGVGVDEALFGEGGHQLVQIAVDVADDEERAEPLPGDRAGFGDGLHLDGVAAVDDGEVALGGGVPLRGLVADGHVAGMRQLGRCGRGRRHGGVRRRRVRLRRTRGQRRVRHRAGRLRWNGRLRIRRNPEVTQRRRPHHGFLTGPLSHRPLHHRRAAVHLTGPAW